MPHQSPLSPRNLHMDKGFRVVGKWQMKSRDAVELEEGSMVNRFHMLFTGGTFASNHRSQTVGLKTKGCR